MKESNTQKLIMLALSKLSHVRIFRNNTASGWAGKSIQQGNDRLVKNAYPLKAGLCTGSSDLIGIRTITITADMVGKTIGQFVACEVKRSPKEEPTPEQINFINMVNSRGGLGFVASSSEEALSLLK